MSSNGLSDVKPGDNLVLATGNRYRGDEPVTVSRVGRQYLYVTLHGREMRERFNRKTGSEDTKYGCGGRLYTQEQYDEMQQRQALFQALLDSGIDVRFDTRAAMSTDKLRALLAVVQDDTADCVTEK